MSKVSVENKNGQILITNRLSYPENVNEQLCSAVSSGAFDGFLPLRISRKRKETSLECDVQGYIPLTQYFSGFVTKKMFLDFVYDIATKIKFCERSMLNANNIEFQYDKIFVDPRDKKVKCIFWPVVNNQRESSPRNFLERLPHDLRFNLNEDVNYLNIYINFFSSKSLFSINSFEKMIYDLSEGSSAKKSETFERLLSRESFGYDSDAAKKSSFTHNKNIEYNPIAEEKEVLSISKNDSDNNQKSVCSFCGVQNDLRSNFCSNCGRKIKKENIGLQDEGTFIVAKDFGVSSTPNNKLSDIEKNYLYPTLTRVSTKEVYVINKAKVSIGSDRTVCDIFVNNNHFISRKHADLIVRNNKYYLIDNKSTNKTFVNGKQIEPYVEVELVFGVDICFADEHFVFGTNL